MRREKPDCKIGYRRDTFTLGNGRIVSETIYDENGNLIYSWHDPKYYSEDDLIENIKCNLSGI